MALSAPSSVSKGASSASPRGLPACPARGLRNAIRERQQREGMA